MILPRIFFLDLKDKEINLFYKKRLTYYQNDNIIITTITYYQNDNNIKEAKL